MLHPVLSRAFTTAHIEDLHRAATADRVATDARRTRGLGDPNAPFSRLSFRRLTWHPRPPSILKARVLERPRYAIARLAGHRGTRP
jgi:hypothetical protein